MNWDVIRTLVAKDVTLYFKNRFFAFVTVLALVAYIVMYFLMPSTVDETLEIGLYAPAAPPSFVQQLTDEGVDVIDANSEAALKEAVAAGDYPVGVVLPADMLAKLQSGAKPQMHVYITSDLPAEFRDMYTILFEEMAFTMQGQALDIDFTEEVLGPDMAGQQIPPRDRMLPLLAVFILMVETMGLASLISMEIETGTLRALLVTPLSVEGLFLGKGLTGASMAFVQVTLLMGVTGGLGRQPLLILLALLLGSMLVTGIAFLMASVSKDMMSVMGWGVLALLLLAIPSLNALLPGLTSDWIKIIPSYYLVDTVYRVVNFGAGWGDVTLNLLILLASALVFLGLGVVVLRRKFT